MPTQKEIDVAGPVHILAFESDNGETTIEWAREYWNDIKSVKDHEGDCIKEPYTCRKCQYEWHRNMIVATLEAAEKAREESADV